MKKIQITLCIVLATIAITATSCSNEDEVVPITDSNTSSTRTYKVADPVLLNATEQAKVSEIRNEYYENVEQY